MVKQCQYCGLEKSTSNFGRNRFRKDGLKSYCRPCTSIVESRWRSRDIEAHRAQRRERYRADPRKQRRASLKYYYQRRPEILARWCLDRSLHKEKYRKYRLVNIDKRRAQQKEGRAAHRVEG